MKALPTDPALVVPDGVFFAAMRWQLARYATPSMRLQSCAYAGT
jgi:hypothetical protein